MLDVSISLFSGFFGALMLFLIKEHLLKPELKIEFLDNIEYAFTSTVLEANTKKVTEAKFLRFKIYNKGKFGLNITAKGVRAYLKKISVTDPTGNNFETNEVWIGLRASDTADLNKTFDLPTKIPQYIDICCCRSDIPDRLSPLVDFPIRSHDLFKKSGTYKAEIVVVSENSDVIEKPIEFDWRSGQFDSLKVIELEQ